MDHHRWEAAQTLAMSFLGAGRPHMALTALEDLRQPGVPVRYRRWATGLAAGICASLGQREEAFRYLDEALRLCEQEGAEAPARQGLLRASVLLRLQEYEGAAEAAAQARHLAGGGRLAAQAAFQMGIALLEGGRYGEAEVRLREAAAEFAAVGDEAMVEGSLQAVGCALLRSGRLEEARAHLGECWRRLAGRTGARWFPGEFAHLLAQYASLHSRLGEVERARWFAGLVLAQDLYRPIALGALARCAALEGDFAAADRHLEEARQRARVTSYSAYLGALSEVEKEVNRLRYG